MMMSLLRRHWRIDAPHRRRDYVPYHQLSRWLGRGPGRVGRMGLHLLFLFVGLLQGSSCMLAGRTTRRISPGWVTRSTSLVRRRIAHGPWMRLQRPLGLLSAAFLSRPVGASSSSPGVSPLPLQTRGLASQSITMPTAAAPQTCLAAAGDVAEPGAATVAAGSKAKKKLLPKWRSSYRQPDFWIRHTDLQFDIVKDPKNSSATITYVTSTLQIERNAKNVHTVPPNLELDGEELELQDIKLNGKPLDPNAYIVTDEQDLIIPGSTLPNDNTFTLETRVLIRPELNSELSGFYASGSMFCTQCEAEGFRRITYYLDRPDVMSKFRVRIEADKGNMPVLLSNGNRLEGGDMEGGRHYAVWEDPFPKPSYLFAVVAGKLSSIIDSFTTKSGRKVHLEIYSEPENVDKLEHAMLSLKNAMKWDEDVYGLEYDLDMYNIVAVNDFNMGAMENKGLNVFNTAFVLAQPETATDTDYERIEGVIAHEYFHNWSGNRVTCRSWFELTLKEGLTVFRDQQFSADMGSAAVKRIEDVRVLRSRQFAEDASPRAHPIRPESYIKNDNFYTPTVYEKGAEVIRMYHTLLGPEGFRKGMDLYWERHDGSAVTCDDFRAAMADANGVDFTQFERWYLQAGTPVVEVMPSYDANNRRYSLTMKQGCPPTTGQPSKLPYHIPIRVGLLSKEGHEIVPSTVLELKQEQQTFHFDNIDSPPIPSVLRGFSAPVRLKLEQSEEDLAFLMSYDTDSFNRWEASQRLATTAIKRAADALADGQAPPAVPSTMIEAFRAVLRASEDQSIDKSLLAYALTLPDEMTMLSDMDVMRPIALHEGREHVRRSLLTPLRDEFLRVYHALDVDVPYSVEPSEIGRRRLKNLCLSYICAARDADAEKLAMEAFTGAKCMTDSLAALSCLASLPGRAKEEALQSFYKAANGDPLVINKWYSIQAMADLPDAVERVAALLKHPDFSLRNPNRVRSLVSAFANSNLAHFHAEDGSGYKLVTDVILDVDKVNGQVAARLASTLSLWRKFELKRRNLMKEQLDRIAATEGLSRDTFEIVQQCITELK